MHVGKKTVVAQMGVECFLLPSETVKNHGKCHHWRHRRSDYASAIKGKVTSFTHAQSYSVGGNVKIQRKNCGHSQETDLCRLLLIVFK